MQGSLFPLTTVILLDGRAGNDVIRGPPANTTWNITGAGAGTFAGVSFAGIETLAGAAGNEDTFVFEVAGSLAGLVDGGAGGFDTLVVHASGAGTASSVAIDGSSGSVTADGRQITYAGLEPVTITNPDARPA